MLGRFRISTVITTGVLALSVIIGLGAFTAVMGARTGVTVLTYSSENLVPSVDVLGRTTVDFELSRVYLTRYLMALDKQESDWAETNLRASMARVDKDLQDYKPLISDRMDGVLYESRETVGRLQGGFAACPRCRRQRGPEGRHPALPRRVHPQCLCAAGGTGRQQSL
jgi:hypothetical protein